MQAEDWALTWYLANWTEPETHENMSLAQETAERNKQESDKLTKVSDGTMRSGRILHVVKGSCVRDGHTSQIIGREDWGPAGDWDLAMLAVLQ